MAETRLLISIIGSAAERGARVVSKALESIGIAALEAGKKVEIFNAKYKGGLNEISSGSRDLKTAEGKLALFEESLRKYALGTEEAAAGSKLFAESLKDINAPPIKPEVDTEEIDEGTSSLDSFGEAINRLTSGTINSLDQALDGIVGKTKQVGSEIRRGASAFSLLGRNIKGPLAVVGSFVGVLAGAANASNDLISALKILDIRLNIVGNIAGASRKEITDLSDELEALYGLNSNDFIRGIERLGRFQNIAVPLEDISKAAADLAAVSPNLGITEAFQQFGEILNDPIRNLNRLRDLGVQFSDSQRENFISAIEESGSSVEAQTAILEEFNRVIGGAALGNIDSIGGSLTNLKIAFSGLFTNEQVARDFKEKVLEPIFTGFNDLADFLRSESVVGGFNNLAGAVVLVTGAVVDLINEIVRFPVDVFKTIADVVNSIRGVESAPTEILNLDDAIENIRGLNTELSQLIAFGDFSGELIPGLDSTKFRQSSDELKAEYAVLRADARKTFDALVSEEIEGVLSTKGIEDDQKLILKLGDLYRQQEVFRDRLKKGGFVDAENLAIAEEGLARLGAELLRVQNLLPGNRIRALEPGEGGTETGVGVGSETAASRTSPADVIADLEKQIQVAEELNDVRAEYLVLIEDFTDAEVAANEAAITGLIERRDIADNQKEGFKSLNALIDENTAATLSQKEAQSGLSTEQIAFNRLLEKFPNQSEELVARAQATVDQAVAQRELNEALAAQEEVYKEVRATIEGTLTPLERQAEKIGQFTENWGRLTQEQQDSLGGLAAYQEALRRIQEEYDELLEKGTDTWLDLDAVAEEFARSMQANFSSLFFDVMQGDFDNLADRFKQTIDRMVADLLASKLLEFLAPKNGEGFGGAVGALIGLFTGSGGGGPSAPTGSSGAIPRAKLAKGGFVSPNQLVEVNENGEELLRVGGMDILLPSPTTKIQTNTPLPIKGFASGGLVNPGDMVEVNELGTEALSIAGEQLIIGSGGKQGSFNMKDIEREQRSTTSQPQVFHVGERTFMKMGTSGGFVIPHDKTKEIIDKKITREAIPNREFGGSVQSRSVYEVNEGVMPELLTVGSRDFLLTGGTSGFVTPMESASELGMNQNVNVTIVTPDVDGFRKTQSQVQNEMGRAASLANRRNG